MFAKHNGQVCFLSLCSTAIVRGTSRRRRRISGEKMKHQRPAAEIPAILLGHIQYARRNASRNRSQRQILGHNHIE